jgi:hypothetical protein
LTETKLNEQKQTEKKQVLTYCAINFAKFEDLELFEQEYQKVLDELNKKN